MKVKNLNDYSVEEIVGIIEEAKSEGHKAAMAFAGKYGNDYGCCGFSWVDIYDVKGNTKLGKKLKAAGIEQNYTRRFSMWNPSGAMTQSMSMKEEGDRVVADVLTKYGFKAYAHSRMD